MVSLLRITRAPYSRSVRFALLLCTILALFLMGGVGVSTAQENTPANADALRAPEPPLLPPYATERVPGGDIVVGDFVVGPGKIDVTLKPGESKVVSMTVTNRTGERRIFNLTTEDMTGSTDLSKPVVLLGSDRGPYSLRDYLQFDHASFELEQNERARIPVTISIPADAEPGGLYGSVLVDTVAIEATGGETTDTVPQSAIVARIGTLYFVTVEGDISRDAHLLDFGTIGKKYIYSEGPITFGILHENTGSMHIAPYGEIRITNMFGEEVGFVELEPWFVLPQAQRLREVTFTREFLFGRYTATARINRSYDDIIDTETYSFWVLPWKIVSGVFLALFLVFFLIRTFFRTFEFKRKS